MQWIQWIVVLFGHLGLWCVAYNRIHATSWPRPSRKFSEKLIFLIVMIPIVYVATTLFSWTRLGFDPGMQQIIESSKRFTFGPTGVFYLKACFWLGIFFILRWSWRKFRFKLPTSLIDSRIHIVDLKADINQPLLHGWYARSIGSLPGNEILTLAIQDMTFELDVPPELDGLKICHLSDLHFTGQIDLKYFENVVKRANAFEPDIIAITGDLVDKRECLSWLDATLGQLKAKYGCYYLLGNHDRRIQPEDTYRGRLESLGLIPSIGRWKSVVHHQGIEILITGNELPWYHGAENLTPRSSKADENVGMKILLSHSPDQLQWAKRFDFDLMLAGHTHGGQIALPIIGPLVAPSKYGVLYAAGTFQVGKMLMHVSRGISGDHPIRYGSRPELGLFTIRSKKKPA